MIQPDSIDDEDPYEVLEIKDGVRAPAKKIGKSFNRLKHRARAIADIAKRTKRLEQLERAKEQLQRPDDRAEVDFNHVGEEIFSDLIKGFGETLRRHEIDTESIVDRLLPRTAYDELIPQATQKMMGEIRLKGVAKSYSDISDDVELDWFK